METLILKMLLVVIVMFSTYIIILASRHKAFKSISDSEYWFDAPWRWLFETLMFVCGGCIVAIGVFIEPSIVWTLVVAGTLIIGVGVFDRFKKNKLVETLHIVSATGGFILLTVSYAISFGAWYYTAFIIAGVIVAYLTVKDKSVRTWYVELTLAYLNFLCLGLVIINHIN